MASFTTKIRRTFTQLSFTHTLKVPVGVEIIEFSGAGGGGSGSSTLNGGATGKPGGSGGGGSAYGPVAVDVRNYQGLSLSIVIGAGGAEQIANTSAGFDGEDTTVTAPDGTQLVVFKGGKGGKTPDASGGTQEYADRTGMGLGGNGGFSSDKTLPGIEGFPSKYNGKYVGGAPGTASGDGGGGSGGGAGFGGDGGRGGNSAGGSTPSTIGLPGGGYGAGGGGGGGARPSSSAGHSGAGYQGILIAEYIRPSV